MAVGDFTASELQVIRLKAEQFYKDNTALYTPEANSAIAVLENQTARFKAFENVDKDVKVAVTWLDACGIEAKDCEETCDIEEDEIESKKNGDPQKSYTAQLFFKGENTICKKIAEEAAELCFAIKDKDSHEVIYEAADLVYHALVGLTYANINPDMVRQELKRRFGISGIDEKKSRSK